MHILYPDRKMLQLDEWRSLTDLIKKYFDILYSVNYLWNFVAALQQPQCVCFILDNYRLRYGSSAHSIPWSRATPACWMKIFYGLNSQVLWYTLHSKLSLNLGCSSQSASVCVQYPRQLLFKILKGCTHCTLIENCASLLIENLLQIFRISVTVCTVK